MEWRVPASVTPSAKTNSNSMMPMPLSTLSKTDFLVRQHGARTLSILPVGARDSGSGLGLGARGSGTRDTGTRIDVQNGCIVHWTAGQVAVDPWLSLKLMVPAMRPPTKAEAGDADDPSTCALSVSVAPLSLARTSRGTLWMFASSARPRADPWIVMPPAVCPTSRSLIDKIAHPTD